MGVHRGHKTEHQIDYVLKHGIDIKVSKDNKSVGTDISDHYALNIEFEDPKERLRVRKIKVKNKEVINAIRHQLFKKMYKDTRRQMYKVKSIDPSKTNNKFWSNI